jgi:hypothetical protein
MNIYICYVGVVQINIGLITLPPFLVIRPSHYIVTHFKFTTLNTQKRFTNHVFWSLTLQVVEINSFCIPFNNWNCKIVLSLQHIKKFFKAFFKLPLFELFELLHLFFHQPSVPRFELNQPPWENMKPILTCFPLLHHTRRIETCKVSCHQQCRIDNRY